MTRSLHAQLTQILTAHMAARSFRNIVPFPRHFPFFRLIRHLGEVYSPEHSEM